jgi:predicted phage-related endonuclease
MTQCSDRRRYFIGGSDARIIMGNDEAALVRLWQEKRGEVEPQDLSGNLVVQLGLATEDLNRRWYEANTGQAVIDVQRKIRHPVLRWMGATLDGRDLAIRRAFQLAGVEFIDENGGGPGVRLRKRQQKKS